MKGKLMLIAAALAAGALSACDPVASAEAAPAQAPVAQQATKTPAPKDVPPAGEVHPDVAIPDDYAPADVEWDGSTPADVLTAVSENDVGPAPYFVPIHYLTLQATTDEVEVTGVSVNRGNCTPSPLTSHGGLPVKLRFGDQLRIPMKDCSSILEAVVETSHGPIEYTFQ